LIAFVPLLVLVAFPRLALPAQVESEWQIGLGGSLSSSYTYKKLHYSFGDFDYSFGHALVASLSVTRKLGRNTALQTCADYFQQEQGSESVGMACMGIGVRASFDPEERARPYLEMMPAVYAGRWSDDIRGNSITSVRPGLVAGMGIVGPLAGPIQFDLSLRGHLSAGWPALRDSYLGSDEYHGVKRMTIGARLIYGL